jgi:hypothetical protein
MSTEEVPFLMVMRASQIVDVSLTPGDKTSGFLTPVVGIDGGIHLDYDRKKQLLFWVEGKEDDDENVRPITICFHLVPLNIHCIHNNNNENYLAQFNHLQNKFCSCDKASGLKRGTLFHF